MTKKDYIAIAGAIKDARYECERGQQESITRVAERIADVLKSDNPRFDRERFMAATRIG